jgi:hypothetical protein
VTAEEIAVVIEVETEAETVVAADVAAVSDAVALAATGRR